MFPSFKRPALPHDATSVAKSADGCAWLYQTPIVSTEPTARQAFLAIGDIKAPIDLNLVPAMSQLVQECGRAISVSALTRFASLLPNAKAVP